MKKSVPEIRMLSEGYVLLEALFSIIIISVFIIALSGLFSSMVKNTIKAESAVAEALTEYNETIDSRTFIFNAE